MPKQPTHTEIGTKSNNKEKVAALPKIKLFYSWQSEVFPKANRSFIRSAIEAAGKEIKEECRLEIDEATRNKAGSPNIPLSIFEKIDDSDVFLCDLSKVAGATRAKKGKQRAYFNSNVSIELGYAIRSLGWSRIILVSNLALGEPEEAPFDVRSHRLSTYYCKENAPRSKAGKEAKSKTRAKLANAIASTLNHLLKDNPPKPNQIPKLTPEQLRREQDLSLMADLFENFDYKTYDRFIDFLGYPYITYDGSDMHTQFSSTYNSAATVFNDKKLEIVVANFAKEWSDCFRYRMYMDMHPSNQYYQFDMPLDQFVDAEQEQQHSFTQDQRTPLDKAHEGLVVFLQKYYPEFSIGRRAVAAKKS